MILRQAGRSFTRGVTAVAQASSVDCATWDVSVGLALIRLPVIVPPMSDIEAKFRAQQAEVEDENSLKSDFELRIVKDNIMLEKRRQLEAEGKDLSQLDDQIGITAEQEENEAKAFAKQIRKEYGLDNRTEWESTSEKSLRRALDQKLLLMVKQKFEGGKPSPWIVPQLKNDGEPLRQTAEKCLGSIVLSNVNVHIVGNAPMSLVRYRYPKTLAQRIGRTGNNIFLYPAYLNQLDAVIEFNKDTVADFRWTLCSEVDKLVKSRSYSRKLTSLLFE